MKTCIRCDSVKHIEDFYKHPGMKDGHLNKCKRCVAEDVAEWRKNNPDSRKEEYKRTNGFKNRKYSKKYYNPNWTEKDRIASRRASSREYTRRRNMRMKGCTPSWANKEEIRYIYKLASERNLVVDHIVPLNSSLVCGLHTPDNLRCIPDKINVTKGNRYWPDMPKQTNSISGF